MKVLFVLVFFCLMVFAGFASILPPGKTEQLWNRVNYLGLMADSTALYLEQIIGLAESRGDAAQSGEAYYQLGKHNFLLMKNASACNAFRSALRDFHKTGNTDRVGFCHVQLGLSFIQENQLDSALLHFNTALEWYRSKGLEQHQWTPYMGISNVYQKEGNLSLAFAYGRKAVEALQYTSDRTSQVVTLRHMLNLARQNDSLQVFSQMSEKLLKLYNPLEVEGEVLQHTSRFVDIKDPVERTRAIQLAIRRMEEWPVTLELVSSWFQLGEVYRERGMLRDAIAAWEKAIRIEKSEINGMHFTPAMLHALSEAYAKQGAYQRSLDYLNAYMKVKDSLQDHYALARTQELQMQFESKAKDLELANQKQILERRTMQRNGIMILVGLLVLTSVYFIYIQRRHLRDQRIIAAQQESLHQKEVIGLKKHHEMVNLQTILNAQEEERKRFAQDLHDSLGSLLLSAKIKLGKLRQHLSVADHHIWPEVLEQLDGVAVETRRIAHNIMPPALSRLGLSAALEDLAGNIRSQHELDVAFQNIDYDQALDPERELTLYRVAQELCANVIRHASADHLLIQLSRHNGSVTLVVEDDGSGFEHGDKSLNGMGLESIQSRVHVLHGEIDIVSSPHEGTSFTVHIPVA